MAQFIVSHILEWIAVSIVVSTLLFFCSLKLLGGLQQCGYGSRKFFAWIKRKDNLAYTSLSLLAFLLLLCSFVLSLVFSFVGDSALVSLASFFIFGIWYFIADRKYALKVKIVKTKRFIRLVCVYCVCLLVATFVWVGMLSVVAYLIPHPIATILRYVPLCALVLALPVVMSVANFIDKLYEIPHNQRYLKKAEATIAKNPNVLRIGITGSYGKTSVKNILNAVLSEKYKVLITPSSYNTPMGIARAVNENDYASYDVFLAEMGARNRGDIEELSDMIMPDYAVVTGICEQHLQSFGSLEEILAAKGEILYGTSKGAVLASDENTKRLYDSSPVETMVAGEEVQVLDVVADASGTTFTLKIEDETRTVKTRLLAEHTADNMCVAATLAYFLDFTIDEIVQGLEKVEPIPHRLEVIQSGGVTILDDSYNANVKGAEDAVGMLEKFGGRHFIVTPGLVELGILEEAENKRLGKRLVGLDRIILVGDTLVSIVKKGYLEEGGDAEKLSVVPTLEKASALLKEELQEGDTVLFLNDLPDVFNL